MSRMKANGVETMCNIKVQLAKQEKVFDKVPF